MGVTITVQFDAEAMSYDLMVEDGMMRPMPAGPRLFRGGNVPAIRFSHETLATAQQDARTLEQYINTPRKGPNKRALKETTA